MSNIEKWLMESLASDKKGAVVEEVCAECEDGGWVQVYSEHPPAFDECPKCHNPNNLPSP